MNCQDVSNVLDERTLGTLTHTERCALDRHLASCADCASGWRAVETLEQESLPAMPADLAERVLAAMPAATRAAAQPRTPIVTARRRPVAQLAVGAAVLALGGAFAALTFLGQTGVRDELPGGGAIPSDAAETDAVLGDTPRRPRAFDDPVLTIERPAPAAQREDAVRFPDGNLFSLLRVPPEYPRAALRAAREGTVRVAFTITQYGTVADVVVEDSTDPIFDASAVLAVERWKYMPRVVDGERVETRGVRTVIRFALAEDVAPPEEQRPRDAASSPEDLLRQVETTQAEESIRRRAQISRQAQFARDEPQAAQAQVNQIRERTAPPPERLPFKDLVAEAWDCAAARDLPCAQQVLDRVTATYELTPPEREQVWSFYGYLYTQYGDFERALGAFREAAAGNPTSGAWITIMHLHFMRQQYQLALDTGVRYLEALQDAGRTGQGRDVERFVEKLEGVGIRPRAAPGP